MIGCRGTLRPSSVLGGRVGRLLFPQSESGEIGRADQRIDMVRRDFVRGDVSANRGERRIQHRVRDESERLLIRAAE